MAGTDILIGRKAFLYYATYLIGAGASFVALLFMTRSLGPNAFGIVSWTFALMTAVNSISDLGFTSTHIKRISEGKDVNDCVSTYIVIQSILMVVMVVATICAILVWVFFLGGSLSSLVIELIVLFLLYYAMADMANIVTDTYLGTMETAKCQLINLVTPLVRAPLIVFLALTHMGAIDIAYAYVVSAMAMLFVAWLFLRRDRIKWQRPTLFRSYYAFALPVALIVVMAALTSNLDKIFIGLFGSNEEVGYYASAQTFLSAFTMIGSAVSLLTLASFSKLYAEGNLDRIREMTKTAERYVSFIVLPVTVIIVLFPEQIADTLFGSNFSQASDPLRILALALLPSILNGIYISQLYAVNRPGLSAKLTLLNFSVNVGLMILLIPNGLFGVRLFGLGEDGAAIAYLVSSLLMLAVARNGLRQLTDSPVNKRIALHLIAAILTGGSILVLSMFVAVTGLVSLIVYCVLTIAMFETILFLMKELNIKDVHYFLDVIDPRKMKDYVSSEIARKR
jgi:O-antigen/teichoic acid export membrane protein